MGAGRCQVDRAPLLSELMPWWVPGLRPGRGWVLSPHREVLAARWQRLAEAPPERRAVLFGPSRSRTVHSSVPQLPGQSTATGRLAREPGPSPEPVRIRHGAFDRLWLLPDQRVLDQARPELWRVADPAQLFATVQPPDPVGPSVTFSRELPDGHRRRGLGRIHPLYRRPGGREPNLAPGLTRFLARALGLPVPAEDVLAWIAAVTLHNTDTSTDPRTDDDVAIPLPDSAPLWSEGVALGRQVLRLECPGPEDSKNRLRLPDGRRPFVRERVVDSPDSLDYDPSTESLLLGEGRIAPVPATAWDYRVGGEPVASAWFARRLPDPDALPGSLEALGLSGWPQQSTTELVDLVTVLALLAALEPLPIGPLTGPPGAAPGITAAVLDAAGVLPAPPWTRRPASVLSHQEEGPEGQFALL